MSSPRPVFRIGWHVIAFAGGIWCEAHFEWVLSSLQIAICLILIYVLLMAGVVAKLGICRSSLWRVGLILALIASGFLRSEVDRDSLSESSILLYKVHSPLQKSNSGKSWKLEVENLGNAQRWRLYLRDSVALPEGSVLYVKGHARRPTQPIYPYQFDAQLYYFTNRLEGDLFAEECELVYREKAISTHEYLRERVNSWPVSSTVKSFYQAMFFGDKSGIDSHDKQAFQQTGLVHILAVSGLHVGLIAALINGLFFLPLFKVNPYRWVKETCVLIGIWAFAWIGGMSPSLLRAAVLFTLMSLAVFTGKKGHTAEAVWMAGFLLLLYDPRSIYDLGFQLSFCAVFGIVYGHQLTIAHLSKWMESRRKWLKKIIEIASVSTWAQLATLPLVLYHFHQFPNYFLLANLIFLPFIPVLLFFGVIVLIADFAFELPNGLWACFDACVQLFYSGVRWMAALPGVLTSGLFLNIWQAISLLIAVLSIILLLAHRKWWFGLLTVLSLILCFVSYSDAKDSAFVHHLNGVTYLELMSERNSEVWTNDTTQTDWFLMNSQNWRESAGGDELQWRSFTPIISRAEVDTFYSINISEARSIFYAVHPSPE